MSIGNRFPYLPFKKGSVSILPVGIPSGFDNRKNDGDTAKILLTCEIYTSINMVITEKNTSKNFDNALLRIFSLASIDFWILYNNLPLF
jgi:hypothetical protein